MFRCIAIDDEPLALRQIAAYCSRYDGLEMEGTFASAAAAREFLSSHDIDLVFVDINMPDESGIDLVRSFDEHRYLVIFTTAYSEYAVEGFKLDAIDYLLKPYSYEEFSRAVGKAQSLHELIASRRSAGEADDAAEEPVAEPSSDDREYLSIKSGYKTSLVKVANIIYLESYGEYVRLYLTDGSKIMTLFRLKNMETALPADSFMRVHRSYIINLRHISGYAKGRVYLDNDEYVPIGENYRAAFTAYVDAIK